MPKKPVKIGIEVWLAVDVETKYTLNAIPCLGKDETRAPLHRLFDWVVTNFWNLTLDSKKMLELTTFLRCTTCQAIATEEDEHSGNGRQSQKGAPSISKDKTSNTAFKCGHEGR